MRKDVECTFGILKKRFAILSMGIKTRSVKVCDKVFNTCCALHNRLLVYDKLNCNWCSINSKEVPFAINRLNGLGEDSTPMIHGTFPHRRYMEDNYRIVNKIPHKIFKKCLVEHFNIKFFRNDIKWLRRSLEK